MAVTPDAGGPLATPRPSMADTLAVYLKRRVLVVAFLGFSSGLPLALSGSTLLVWMREVGVDLHHRPLCPRRHALYGEIPLGAARRCARRAGAVAALRPAPRLAVAGAVSAHRRDRLARRLRS